MLFHMQLLLREAWSAAIQLQRRYAGTASVDDNEPSLRHQLRLLLLVARNNCESQR
jgi:hypothetical protein